MNEQEITKRIQVLTTHKRLEKDYTPLTEEEISSKTGVELEKIKEILKNSLKSLADKGVTEEHLNKLFK